MSSIYAQAMRAIVALQFGLVARRDQRGQSTAEYGVVILVAIALGTAVLMLFTGGALDDSLKGLLQKVLSTATAMVKGS